MALVYRAYYALIRAPRVTTYGVNTSAIFGYTNTLITILATRNPTHIAVAFDTPEPTARHAQFPAYKAHREAIPEDIAASLSHIRRMIAAFNIPVILRPGYEADDIIGTLATVAEGRAIDTYMVTMDKDFGQLVSEHIHLYKPSRSGEGVEILGPAEILQRWGISRVEQVTDILGLAGDSSDNIPGVPGIGEKTAITLIQRFDSIENLLANVGQLKGKQRENVERYADQALLSKRLVTIDRHVPDLPDIDALRRQEPNKEAVTQLLNEFECASLGKRIFGDAFAAAAPTKTTKEPIQYDLFDSPVGSEPPLPETAERQEPLSPPPMAKTIKDISHRYTVMDTLDARKELIAKLSAQTWFCFDVETTGLDPKTAELVGIAFCWEKGVGYFVPIPPERELARSILAELQQLFADPQIGKLGHNLKFDLSILHWHGIAVCGTLDDTMLAHYLINPEGRHGMDALSVRYLQYQPIPITTLIGEKGSGQRSMREVALEELVEYSVEDADVTVQLHHAFQPILRERDCEPLYRDVETRLIPVLIAMESEGIALNVAALTEYGVIISRAIGELEIRIHQQAGLPFNIDSPRQLGEVLFDRLQLDDEAKRTVKSGQYKTSEQVLMRLAGKHPIINDVLDYRALRKLKSTYVDTLPTEIFPTTGRLHTTYHQAVTATGRLQSQSPNLQNIPIKTERGREIRKAFIPRAGGLILSADYSQIELRIIAGLSGDEAMAEAFIQNLDVHRATAARIFGVALPDVTDDMRRKSKMVNFGIIYGISAFGLAERLNIPRQEARFIIEQYFCQYPKVKEFLDRTIEFARQHGYVKTVLGRRRYLPDINSKNATIRGAAERTAVNAPIQGTAADMIKVAMIRIHETIQQRRWGTRMLLQVHDELVFDLRPEEQDEVVPAVKQCMETAIPLSVPIVVDTGIGRNWLEAH